MLFRYLLKWPYGETESASWQLVSFLAATAGATTAAGFWSVWDHEWMTTQTAFYSNEHPHQQFFLLLTPAVVLLVCFIAGTAVSSVLGSWQERNGSEWIYGFSLLLEACLLAGCGLLGTHLADHEWPFLVSGAALFSFLLALQNAMILSALSQEREKDHIGGIVTDLGIELGNLVYETTTRKIAGKPLREGARTRLTLLTFVVGFFWGGVLLGTLGFNQLGFLFYLIFSAFLFCISTASLIANRLSA